MTNKKHNYDWDAMWFDPDPDGDVYGSFIWEQTTKGHHWWAENKHTPEGQAEFARMKRLYAEDMAAMESLDWFRLTRHLWPNDEKKGPVRTVTRKEIVPGVYGTVVVDGEFVRMEDTILGRSNLGVLDAAIETLTQIRDAL